VALCLASTLAAQQPGSKTFVAGVIDAGQMPRVLVFVPLDEWEQPDQGVAPLEVRLAPDGTFAAELAPGRYAVAYHPPCGQVTGFRLVAGAESVKLALAWTLDGAKPLRGGTSTALAASRIRFSPGAPAIGAALPAGNLDSGAQAVAGARLPIDPKLSQAAAVVAGRSSVAYVPYTPNLTTYRPSVPNWSSFQMPSLSRNLSIAGLTSSYSASWSAMSSFTMPSSSIISSYRPLLTTVGSPLGSSLYSPWKPISTPMPALPKQPTIPTWPIGKQIGGVFLNTHLSCDEGER
jgi:hypothetical protein